MDDDNLVMVMMDALNEEGFIYDNGSFSRKNVEEEDDVKSMLGGSASFTCGMDLLSTSCMVGRELFRTDNDNSENDRRWVVSLP